MLRDVAAALAVIVGFLAALAGIIALAAYMSGAMPG